MLPEQSFLLLQKLLDTCWRKLALSYRGGVLVAVHKTVHVDLELNERVEELANYPPSDVLVETFRFLGRSLQTDVQVPQTIRRRQDFSQQLILWVLEKDVAHLRWWPEAGGGDG